MAGAGLEGLTPSATKGGCAVAVVRDEPAGVVAVPVSVTPLTRSAGILLKACAGGCGGKQ